MSRRALVIGNARYERGLLVNPRNDAEAMARQLAAIGFEVVKWLDLARDDLHDAIANFSENIGTCEAVTFFYAGHGMQVDGENFILPIDANIRNNEDVAKEGISLNRFVLPSLSAPIRLIFLDACRDNPFVDDLAPAESVRRSLAEQSEFRQGLASIRVDVGEETFIAFATAPDATASDGKEDHSPFTNALLARIGEPHRNIFDIITAVGADVRRATSGRQIPWFQSSLQLPFYFIPPPAISAEQRWSEIESTKHPATLRAFVKDYPQSEHAPQALRMLRSLDDQEWGDAQLENSDEGYQFYLLRWPSGVHRPEAEAAIETLIVARHARDWEEVSAENTTEAYEGYKVRWPDGPHVAAANSAIEVLKDDAAFDAARRANSPGAYKTYLKEWPQGRSAGRVRQALTVLAWNAWFHVTRHGRSIETCDGFLKEWPKGECAEKQREDVGWLRAQRKNSTEGYREYLECFPRGGHFDEGLWECARRINTVESYDEYLTESGSGAFREDAEWHVACLRGTRKGYDEYLLAWPDGKYVEEARDRIKALELAANEVSDAMLWNKATQSNTVEAYVQYLSLSKKGVFRDDAEWQIAYLKNTPASYNKYLEAWPRGKCRQKAERRIRSISDGLRQKIRDRITMLAPVFLLFAVGSALGIFWLLPLGKGNNEVPSQMGDGKPGDARKHAGETDKAKKKHPERKAQEGQKQAAKNQGPKKQADAGGRERAQTAANTLEVAPELRWGARWNANTKVLVFRGQVPTADVRRALLHAADKGFRDAKVQDGTTVGSDRPRDWQTIALAGLRALANLQSGDVSLEGSELRVSGEAETAAHAAEARRAIQGLGIAYTVKEQITVLEEPNIRWVARWDAKFKQLILEEQVPSESVKERLLEEAKRSFPGANIDHGRMTTADGRPEHWQATAVIGLRSLAMLDEGTAIIAGQTLKVIGKTDSEQRGKNAKLLATEGLAEPYKPLLEISIRAARPRPLGKPSLEELPEIRVVDITTGVPVCVTADRLEKFLHDGVRDRDAFKNLSKSGKEEMVNKVKARFGEIAKEYERQGQELGLRWDFAFFQMLITTNYLVFGGKVRGEQNNFCGLGVKDGMSGDTFPDMKTGVRAHLEYLLVLAGEKISKPASEHIAKIQGNEILDERVEVAKKGARPTTFSVFQDPSQTLLTKARDFYDDHCN